VIPHEWEVARESTDFPPLLLSQPGLSFELALEILACNTHFTEFFVQALLEVVDDQAILRIG